LRTQHFARPGYLEPFPDGFLSLAARNGLRHKARKIIRTGAMTNCLL
jgi:hypothetical protein